MYEYMPNTSYIKLSEKIYRNICNTEFLKGNCKNIFTRSYSSLVTAVRK